ncbi:MAG: hypothetical protein ACOC1O_05105 [bacterium]
MNNYINDENLDKLLSAWKEEKTISSQKIEQIQDQILNSSFDYNWWMKFYNEISTQINKSIKKGDFRYYLETFPGDSNYGLNFQ